MFQDGVKKYFEKVYWAVKLNIEVAGCLSQSLEIFDKNTDGVKTIFVHIFYSGEKNTGAQVHGSQCGKYNTNA